MRLFFPVHPRLCLPAYALFALCLAQSAQVRADTPKPAGVAATAHDHTQESARIRQLHLRRLDERLIVEPQVLHEQCRFESDISTRPPQGQIALTFDDGPEPGQTELILDVLRKHHISATFFLIGEKAKEHPELVTRIQAAGTHLIGNHSWSHPNFHDIPDSSQLAEITAGAAALPVNLTPKLFRYPYGNASCTANTQLHNSGYRIVGWHVDSCDWAFDSKGEVDGKEAIACGVAAQNTHDFVEHVLAAVRARTGGIILLHEIHPHTLAQLDTLITRLEQEGFRFTRLDDAAWAGSMR